MKKKRERKISFSGHVFLLFPPELLTWENFLIRFLFSSTFQTASIWFLVDSTFGPWALTTKKLIEERKVPDFLSMVVVYLSQ